MEQETKERLAVIETLIRELTKSNERISQSIKDLSIHVNEEIRGHQKRIQILEINKATSALKWNILKASASFFGGAFISLLIILLVG